MSNETNTTNESRSTTETRPAASRRSFIKNAPLALTAIAGIVGFASRANAAAALTCEATARQAKGPFYPIVNQADKDMDLTTVQGRAGTAVGEVVWIEGIVRDQACKIVPGTLVEIWQACASGKYNHPNDPNTAPIDPDFQYWGRAVTDANGHYRFKTILPGAYPADKTWMRPPHIHFRVIKRGYHELITQMYFAGEALNEDDLILKSLSEADQKSVVVDFLPNAITGEKQGVFDIQIRSVTGV